MKWLRRGLLELRAMLLIAAIVGFLGPFGSYLEGPFLQRFGSWTTLLAGAYILVRPIIIVWRWIAKSTGLPQGSLVFCGVLLCTFPMTLLWQAVGRDEVRLLGGYPGLLPFTVLCALAIMAVVSWAARADVHLGRHYVTGTMMPSPVGLRSADEVPPTCPPPAIGELSPTAHAVPLRLHARLSPSFDRDILALESEDHYVRVHGRHRSELVLLRLRDAIAEMDAQAGQQTHRSWWVAKNAVAGIVGEGRNRRLKLTNGLRVPVARDSIDALKRSGFLPE